jgi:hypothetical protein
MPIIYNPHKKKGFFKIPSGATSPPYDASFSYAKSSYENNEADPIPTITGTSGGTFSAGSGLVFVDSGTNTGSSTGEIDLSATTINNYLINYSVGLASQKFALGVTQAFINDYSMEFNGVDEYLTMDSLSSILTNTDFTLSMWFKGGGQSTSADSSNILFSAHGASTANILRIGIAKTSGGIYFAATGSVGGVVGSVDYDDGNWYHLAITKPYVGGGAAGIVYINGSSIGSTEIYNIDFNSATHYSLAQEYDPTLVPGDYFTGNVDEVGIWNTALGATEITEIYNSGTPTALDTDSGNYTSSADLQAWYRMGD